MSNFGIEFGPGAGAKIAVDCSHVEGGACTTCLEPLLLEAVKGRAAQKALESLDKVLVLNLRAIGDTRKWIRRQQSLQWKVSPGSPAPTPGGEEPDHG